MTIANTANRPHDVYRMFDETGALLYVGCTVEMGPRMHHHSLYKAWFSDVRSVTIERHPDRATGLAAEAEAIRTERPMYDGAGVDLPAGVKRLCVSCRRGKHDACSTDARMTGRWGIKYPCSCVDCAYERHTKAGAA